MTNLQGAPEALPDPSPDQLRAIARTARNSSGSASDDCGPLAYVMYGWRAAAIAFRAQQAATHVQNPAEIEHVAGDVSKTGAESNMAQQPAPSAAAAGEKDEHGEWDGSLPESLQKSLNALRFELPTAVVNGVEHEVRSTFKAMHTSLTTARRMYGAARDRLEALEAAQPKPDPFATPQADSQPAAVGSAVDLPPLPDPDLRDVGTTPGGIKEFLRGYATEYARAALAARAPADSQPAPQGETNAQLDIDSNSSAPGQQRDVAGSVALGQPVGNGSDQAAGHTGAQGDKLLIVAERNIRSFLRSAVFKSESDREAALNCVDVLWEAASAPADSVLEDAARLDFLIEQRAYVVSAPDACPGYWLHFVHKETGKCWVQGDEHPTPRAAIDAARKQGGVT